MNLNYFRNIGKVAALETKQVTYVLFVIVNLQSVRTVPDQIFRERQCGIPKIVGCLFFWSSDLLLGVRA
jgi:hypothetical protein